MTDAVFTAEEFATWTRAKDAFALVAAFVGDPNVAASAIFNRLEHGLLKAAAGAVVTGVASGRAKHPRMVVSKEVWAQHTKDSGSSLPIWKSGDTEITYYPSGASRGSTTVHLYDVRFDPALLGAWISGEDAKRSATLANEPYESEPKGPPISQAALEAWHVAYQLAYLGAEDTLAKAYASAEGMFPGKFVARQRIRDLLKHRKAGRKSK